MPIARIITSMPELSGGLVRDLNSRGFEVLIISPEQTVSGVADLEIRLDVAGSEQTMSEVYANNSLNSLAMQMAATEQDAQEDIWAMLAAFDGDAEKPSEQKLAAAGIQQNIKEQNLVELDAVDQDVAQDFVHQSSLEQTAEQSAVQNREPSAPVESPEDLTSPVLAREEIVASVETPVAESVVSVSAGEGVSRHASLREIDPELVPSMFNFSGGDGESDAAQSSGSAEPEAMGEEKQYLDGNDFRNLVAKKNGAWSFRPPRLMTAAGWAAVAMLLLFSVMHHHSPMPPDANAGQVPFHPAASTASIVPVKSVLITNTGIPIKTTRRNEEAASIAEDTIVHYGDKTKPATLTPDKHMAVKYYTDLDKD